MVGALALGLSSVSCGGDGPAESTTGTIEVTTASSGEGIDTDGYIVQVDSTDSQPVGSSQTVMLSDVAAGERVVSLSGVQANCTVQGEHPRTVTVTGGATAEVQFEVECRNALVGKIVFFTNRDPTVAIWVMNRDGSSPARLIDTPGADKLPSVSPDGTRVLFISDRDNSDDVFVVNADGSQLRNLTNSPALFETSACWSPDGQRIAFAGQPQVGHNFEIFVMNADGSGVVNLTNAPESSERSPAWSPDGTKILFSSNRGEFLDQNLEIYVMNADGTGQTNLTNNPEDDDFDGAWSPDGNRIVFQRRVGGNDEIFVINADGTGETNVTTRPEIDERPSWSPEGDRIAFGTYRLGDGEVFLMNPDGSGVMNLTVTPRLIESTGGQAWGP